MGLSLLREEVLADTKQVVADPLEDLAEELVTQAEAAEDLEMREVILPLKVNLDHLAEMVEAIMEVALELLKLTVLQVVQYHTLVVEVKEVVPLEEEIKVTEVADNTGLLLEMEAQVE